MFFLPKVLLKMHAKGIRAHFCWESEGRRGDSRALRRGIAGRWKAGMGVTQLLTLRSLGSCETYRKETHEGELKG